MNKFVEDFGPEKKSFSWYLLGSVIIILFSFLGQFPMFFFLPKTITAGTSPMDLFKDLDSNLVLFLYLFPFLIAFFGFLFVIKKLHQQTLTQIITANAKIDYKKMGFAFGFWTVITLFIFVVDYALSPEDYLLTFQWQPFLIMLLISLVFIPFQSGLEELLFRGYLLQGFASLTKSRLGALLLTSIIFGSLHIANPEIQKLGMGLLAYYIGTGFFFGIIALMDEGIEIPLGLHIANNLITALLVTADWTAFQTESIFKDISSPTLGSELLVFLGIVYPLSLYYLGKRYGWKNWKHKLTARTDEHESDL